jgi:hypothetical protein
MTDSDPFLISQLAKELVAIRTRKLEDPCAIAAGMVRETVLVALKSRPQEAERVVADACYGALQGLLLSGHDLARGAALMLGETAEVAASTGLDPADVMRYALDGFARIRRMATQDQVIEMLDTLEGHFHGTGEAFAAALAKQPDPGARQRV